MMINPYRSLIAAIAVSSLLLTACGTNDPEVEEKKVSSVTFTLRPDELTFTADGGEKTIELETTSASWKVTASADWATVTPADGNSSGRLTVTVPSYGMQRRRMTFTFSDDTGAKGTATLTVTQEAGSSDGAEEVKVAESQYNPAAKNSSTTYQLLVYSFSDSGTDGVGDFKGIVNRLDYFDKLGVTALWLSPAHPTGSYHAYDVNDYYSVNSLYGSEADFKELIDAAHEHGIKIYMDYVLNHSGKGNTWFQDVMAKGSASPYYSYYVISDNPDADVAAGKVDNYAGKKSPGMGSWHNFTMGNKGYTGRLHFMVDMGAKTVTVTESDDAAQSPNTASAKCWLWIGSAGAVGLYETSSNIHEITVDVDTDWGFLVRTSSTSWDGGTKYGAPAGSGPLKFGVPFALDNSTAADITFGGSASYYFASFDSSMPDLNYGPYASASESAAFKDLVKSAKKWIDLGVDGFRLDAVVWIYQESVSANQAFLSQWYDAVNAEYHNSGHADDIFMVGEAWKGHSEEAQYYKGINSCFEFEYFGALTEAVNGNASNYVNKVNKYLSDHTAVRADAITSIFMTNHDQDRAAESLNRNAAKEKQAAAMLLTSPGKPFIYQGEELGYWGNKGGGDEYVRTPILWDKEGNQCAKKGVNNKVDNNMLTSSISVEAQEADASSLLNVYKAFSQARATYPALGKGTMTAAGSQSANVASWFMTAADGQKALVVHNVSGTTQTVNVSGASYDNCVAILGGARIVKRGESSFLQIDSKSSAVFIQ